MSETLSKGYKNPETGDRGSSFFPDLNSNIERINGHKHDGDDGERINIKDLVKQSQTLLAEDWGDQGDDIYTQLVAMPTGTNFNDTAKQFMISGGDDDGTVIYPTIRKSDTSEYEITVNDPNLVILVTYG